MVGGEGSNASSRIGIGHGTPTSILHLKDTVAGGDCQLAIEAESGNDAVLLLDTSNGSGATADVRFAMDGTTKGKISFLNDWTSSSVKQCPSQSSDNKKEENNAKE